MTNCRMQDFCFLTIFDDFERNRMYPLGYKKGSTMTKLTQKHYDAIVRAETGLIRLYDPATTAKVRHEFENDMRLIGELKKFVQFLIYSPGLPDGPANRIP